MKRVVLIGAGQLGSRYLQGLALCKNNLQIEVVETFKESADVAKERYEQTESYGEKCIEFFSKIDNISNDIDIAIISTNSDVRADIIYV